MMFCLPLLFSHVHDIQGQAIVEKDINRELEINSDGKLKIENKYGDIEVTGWAEDKIKVSIYVRVKDNTSADAEELLDRIEPKFLTTSEYISIVSEIEPKKKGFLNNLFREISFNLDKTNIDINYTVYMPRTASLVISNVYGDVLVTDFEGSLMATIEHGDLRISSSVSTADLRVEFGMLDASILLRGEVTMKNGRLKIDEAEDLRINSSGTELEINTINSLFCNSNKDKLDIMRINSLQGDIRFSTIHIKELGDHLNTTLHFSDLLVEKISSKRPELLIDQSSADIDLNIAGTSIEIDAKMEEGQLIVPKSVKNLEKEWLIRDDNLRLITGTYGEGEHGTFKLSGKKGVIMLRE
jgi:hypothetical protein